jgi:hypothetical protein
VGAGAVRDGNVMTRLGPSGLYSYALSLMLIRDGHVMTRLNLICICTFIKPQTETPILVHTTHYPDLKLKHSEIIEPRKVDS